MCGAVRGLFTEKGTGADWYLSCFDRAGDLYGTKYRRSSVEILIFVQSS